MAETAGSAIAEGSRAPRPGPGRALVVVPAAGDRAGDTGGAARATSVAAQDAAAAGPAAPGDAVALDAAPTAPVALSDVVAPVAAAIAPAAPDDAVALDAAPTAPAAPGDAVALDAAPTAPAALSDAVALDVERRRSSRSTEVWRAALTARLVHARVPLVVLRAPAGYGKSVLLAQWAAVDPRPFVELDAPELEPSPIRLPAAVRAALAGAGTPGRRIVVVIDDADAARPDALPDLVARLTATLPAGSTVALALRSAPSPQLRLGRRRERGEVVELDAGQLAMGVQEAGALLARAGVAVAPDAVARLVDRTEGWPAALRLAARAARGDLARLDDLRGDDPAIADYLREEILDALPADQLALLEGAALLRPLTGPACDAVLGRDGSSAELHRLARGSVPLTARPGGSVPPTTRGGGPVPPTTRGGGPVPPTTRGGGSVPPTTRGEGSFHLHPLLGELLAAQLRERDPARARAIDRAACAWHAQRGELARAIDHATAAGDADRTGTLLWEAVAAGAPGMDPAAIRDWLGRFRTSERRAHPALAIAAAFERVHAGDREAAERWADAARRAPRSRAARSGRPHAGAPRSGALQAGTPQSGAVQAGTPQSGALQAGAPPAGAPGARPSSRSVDAGLALLRAAIARDGVSAMGIDAANAYDLDTDDGPWRPLACLLHGAALHLTGERDRARAVLREGACRGARASLVQALCEAQLALLALDEDDVEAAVALADRARRTIRRTGGEDDPAAALIAAARGLAHARDGRLDEARAAEAQGRRLLDRFGDPAPWYAALTRVALAGTLLRLGDGAEARTTLAGARRCAHFARDALVLHELIDALWGEADDLAAAAMTGPGALTTAELRILRFLPSHLAFREIAALLHVSANTVKTHAHAIYRKLDATSRSEAVARARAIGLVEG